MRRVRKFVRNDRGFHSYGTPIKDVNGGTLEVYESSAVMVGKQSYPFVWLRIDAQAWDLRANEPAVGHAHLNERQVEGLIARLETWREDQRRARKGKGAR